MQTPAISSSPSLGDMTLSSNAGEVSCGFSLYMEAQKLFHLCSYEAHSVEKLDGRTAKFNPAKEQVQLAWWETAFRVALICLFLPAIVAGIIVLIGRCYFKAEPIQKDKIDTLSPRASSLTSTSASSTSSASASSSSSAPTPTATIAAKLEEVLAKHQNNHAKALNDLLTSKPENWQAIVHKLFEFIDVTSRDTGQYTDGFTPLHIVAQHGEETLIEPLLQKGADINAKTTVAKRTPLHEAAMYGRIDVVKTLLLNKADVDAKGDNYETPLLLAVFNKI